MIPYPKNPESYIARIRDLETNEYLVFSETMENPLFLEKNLKGIYTLVVALDSDDELSRARHRDQLKALQKKYKVQRLIMLFPGETAMLDLDV